METPNNHNVYCIKIYNYLHSLCIYRYTPTVCTYVCIHALYSIACNYKVSISSCSPTLCVAPSTTAPHCPSIQLLLHRTLSGSHMLHPCTVYVAVEVRKQTLYRILILRKWHLKFLNDFDVIIDAVLDCLLYACKTFNGHSVRLCFMCVQRCME